MKRILITGANSYIGMSFEKYLGDNYAGMYQIDTLDMLGDSWKNYDFGGYDCVFHVAGIAYSDSREISPENEKMYRLVNTDLAIETAKKAKDAGVGQFIFMSSAVVYGNTPSIGKERFITKDTKPVPENCYGASKLQAETGLKRLEDVSFRIVILRPPMIYGKGSKGNYPVLSMLASKLPVFPKVDNKRSMLYVFNLIEFVRLMIENEERGTFWPQNAEYSNTSELVRIIAETKGRNVVLIPGCTWILKILSHFTGRVNKAFGNLVYDQDLGKYKDGYQKYTLLDSIRETEK